MAGTNFLLFRFAGRTLALEAGLVRQVVPVEHVFTIPGVGGALLGLIPASGRSLPLVDLASLAKLDGPEKPASEQDVPDTLGLLCEVAGEQFALPAEQVIGFVNEDKPPLSSDLLSEEALLGGYYGGGQRGQVINPTALIGALQERFIPL